LSYRAARLHRLAESIPCNRFLGSLNVYKYGLRYMHTVCGGEGGVGLFWRLYIAVLLHSVRDLSLQNCSTLPGKQLRRGGGLKIINTCRKVLFQVILDEEILHCLL
jgi:hypothetical protein